MAAGADLVAIDQATEVIPSGDYPVERLGLQNHGQADEVALLGGLDHVALEAIDIHPLGDGAARDHRAQPPCPHFRRLLGQIVETRVLERGKEIINVGQGLCVAQLALAFQNQIAFARLDDFGQPFSVSCR